jgi:hypothetical protein
MARSAAAHFGIGYNGTPSAPALGRTPPRWIENVGHPKTPGASYGEGLDNHQANSVGARSRADAEHRAQCEELAAFRREAVAYNMRLLSEAGYIKANILESHTGDGHITAALARSLTNSGHELLNTIRSDTVWFKIQETFKKKGMDMTIELVMVAGKKITEALLLS